MMKYGIVIFPSKAIQDAANSYRKRYDPHYALIPPHITLKSPFEMDEANTEELTLELKQVANDMQPFKINIRKASTFAPVTNTIYFKIEAIEELNKLYEKLQKSKFPSHEEHSFVPHITIAQKISEGEYSDVRGNIEMKDVEFEDNIDRFHLVYQLENGSWTVHESFVFGEEKI